jgi:hypothetical protein|tara:strand:+ start:620 stop:802 length:183 start_codon:yes stop_codon:yes gene_type:complete
MAKYKLVNVRRPDNSVVEIGITWTEGGVIYFASKLGDNKDYQEYLEWVEDGNTPDPADDV